jgi:transcriptional regulator with XRE-family HTH domain
MQAMSDGPDMNGFALKMKAYRAQAKMSLDDVAKAAGMTKSHIWELEQGRSKNPTVRAVWAIASALGCLPDDLLGLDPTASGIDPLATRIANLIREEFRP